MGQRKKRPIHRMDANMEMSDEETNLDTDAELTLHKMTATVNNPPGVNIIKSETDSISSVIKVQMKIEGLPTEMEDDTCVEVSIISRELCQGFALTLFVLCFVSCVYVLCQHMVLLIVFLAMCSFSPSSSCPFYHTLLLAWLI